MDRQIRRMALRGTPSLLSAMALWGVVVGGCKPEFAPPCVEGLEAGDTLEVTVLEEYAADSSFEYDLEAYFGSGSVAQEAIQNCSFDRELALGETLIVDVTFDEVDYADGDCMPFQMRIRDLSLAELGEPGHTTSWAFGGRQLGVTDYPNAIVGGCPRWWSAYFLALEGVSPTAPPVAGELPPALLLRGVAGTQDDCTYSDDANYCLFVVAIARE